MTVRTRFAPSPTGYLHIGGARTAYLNWLFAAANHGEFLLRVEDTDKERSTEEAIKVILEGMSWLGLHHDKDVVYQSSRASRHMEIVDELLSSGHAFKCYAEGEELNTLREEALKEGRAIRSPWRDAAKKAPEAASAPVIRLKAPETDISINDHIRGEVTVKAKDIDDLVLCRSDGTPTYMLAVVVDDHDMDITHVIRGDDHLTNALRQQVIYQALGWPTPEFAHVPLIFGEDGKKLSKRHGSLAVTDYRDQGYLPEALLNYLLRLGWSHGDEEIIPREKAVKWFDLKGLGKSPSRMDLKKLDHLNQHFLSEAPDAEIAALLKEALDNSETHYSPAGVKRAMAAIDIVKTKAKSTLELAKAAEFLLIDHPIEINDKAKKQFKPENAPHIAAIFEQLQTLQNWQAEAIEAILNTYAEENEMGFGKFGPFIRAALTGGRPSPDLAVTLEKLGKEESLARIQPHIVTEQA